MKIERAWIGLLAAVQVVFAGPALAGGPTNQGVLFSGEGLDWQRTATETQLRWHLPYPLPKTPFTVNAAKFTSLGCGNITTNIERCRATVELAPRHSPSKFCGRWLDPQTGPRDVILYAFKGYVESTGSFLFPGMTPDPAADPKQAPPKGPGSVVTLACELTPSAPQPVLDKDWSAMGALGKCMDWPKEPPDLPGFPPTGGSTPAVRLFESCIRMVRGDYCGDGVTHTKDSTLIDPYLPAAFGKHVVQPAFILEANWNEQGAICIIHARYVALPASCQEKFPVPFDTIDKPTRTDAGIVFGMRGSDYWCRKGPYSIDQNCKGGKPEPCPWFKQFKDAITEGYLMNDSLLQP